MLRQHDSKCLCRSLRSWQAAHAQYTQDESSLTSHPEGRDESAQQQQQLASQELIEEGCEILQSIFVLIVSGELAALCNGGTSQDDHSQVKSTP